MNRSVLMAAVLVLTPLAVWGQAPPLSKDRDPSYSARGGGLDARAEQADTPSAFHLRDGIATALETVERACAADIEDYCPRVTAGEGRLVLCMRAHEDQLRRGCQFALHRVSRGLESMVKRVAEACWTEVRELCGDVDKIGQCVAEKTNSLSSTCQRIVAALGQQAKGSTVLVGMPVYSSDNKKLGQVVEVVKTPDGKTQSIQVDIGRVLGLGSKVVAIGADKIEPLDGIKVLLSDAEIRSLPEAKKQ